MRARFQSKTIDQEKRTVDVVFGSDSPTKMFSWDYGRILETLSFKKGHVNLDRLNGGAPVLDNHMSFGPVADIVIGVVEKAWVKGNEGHATIRFSENDNGSRVMGLVKEGVLRNISVGYSVNKYEITRNDDSLDEYTAIDWEPHEISMVAVPADAKAQVRSFDNIELVGDVPDSNTKKDNIIETRSRQIRAILAQNPNN